MAYYKVTEHPKEDSTVREMQSKLNCIKTRYNCNWPYLQTDGKYNKQTALAVKGFQQYRNITPASGEMGDTTIGYINEMYNNVPQLYMYSASRIPERSPKRSTQSIGQTLWDLTVFSSSEGLPLYEQLEKAFPLAFQRISKKCNSPLFVFTRQEAYHSGNKYERIHISERVSRYLNNVATIWQWLVIWKEIRDYKEDIRAGGFSASKLATFSSSIFTLCTSTMDVIATYIPRLAAYGYTAAETGSAVTLAGGAALSTIGQCIGAFLLGCEVGKLIGDIPVGEEKRVQDLIDEQINQAWEHPYQTLGPTPTALALDGWKKIIEFNVNRVSALKPLTPDEKRKLEQYKLHHKEMYITSAPPKMYINSGK